MNASTGMASPRFNALDRLEGRLRLGREVSAAHAASAAS